VRPAAAPGLALALLLAACATAPPPLPLAPDEASSAVKAWEERRAAAYSPRRIKALFKGEAAPKVGVTVRGYLSVFWDGTTLVWKASAPLAGSGRNGRLTRSPAPAGESSPFPSGLASADVIGALLGVLDLPAAGRPASRTAEGIRLSLDDEGRRAFLSPNGTVASLAFPDGTRVTLEAASPFPLRLSATGPRGTATLVLESWADWPEGEPVAGGEA
jgi:hypothetical protein